MPYLLVLLAACAQTPASIEFDGEPTVTVHTFDAVKLRRATVLDATGKPIEPQPALSWSVTPDEVARLDGDQVTPIAGGEARITARVGDVSADYRFVVALPDRIEIAAYTAGTPFGVGTTFQVTASVKAGEIVLEGQPIRWKSSNPGVMEIRDDGQILVKSAGTATITATTGGTSSTLDITGTQTPPSVLAPGRASVNAPFEIAPALRGSIVTDSIRLCISECDDYPLAVHVTSESGSMVRASVRNACSQANRIGSAVRLEDGTVAVTFSQRLAKVEATISEVYVHAEFLGFESIAFEQAREDDRPARCIATAVARGLAR